MLRKATSRALSTHLKPTVSIDTPRTIDKRLEGLQEKVARTEARRQEFLQEEMRIRFLDNKFGRAGHYPAYPDPAVAVPYEDRIPHLADRLGKYGQIHTTSQIHEWLSIECDQDNPAYYSAFVQRPIDVPDEDVNFEKGELIYHNPAIQKNCKLMHQVYLAIAGNTVLNVLQTIFTGRAIWPIGDEFMDTRSLGSPGPNFSWVFQYGLSGLYTWHDLTAFAVNGFLAPLLPAGLYVVFKLPRAVFKDVAIKVEYNADKDLVFVTKGCQNAFSNQTKEYVYELSHLQVLPPSVGIGAQFSDTVFTITDMYSQDHFYVFKDEALWNQKNNQEFMKKIYNLWKEGGAEDAQ